MTLRTRLAITFFLTALLTGVAVAWLGAAMVTRARDHLQAETEAAAREAAGRAEQELGNSVTDAAAGIASLLEATGNRDPGLALQGARLAGLDILQILDRNGMILNSLHWPEQVGSRQAGPLTPADGSAVREQVAGPRGEQNALVVRLRLDTGGDSRTLVAGAWMDRLPPTEPVPVPEPVTAGDFLLPALLFAVLAGLIGILLARILTRPLDEMTRAMDAVAAGDEDHDYPQPRTDEFGPLVASFSRMRSSLDREQARLQAVERVAAWRETARRVAHEIKNPLVPIRLTMENLIKARGQGAEQFDPVFEEGARAVLEEVGRLGRIVDAFSAYARMPRPEIRDAELDAVLDPVVALFSGEQGLAVERVSGEEAIPIGADPDLLAQAFRNILSNCREAMGEGGGTLRVETRQEDNAGVVEISDTGPGMGPEVLERLFDPYFTTREEGTGLGMAIAHRIVTEHGGSIDAGNREGGGARFTVSIPLASA